MKHWIILFFSLILITPKLYSQNPHADSLAKEIEHSCSSYFDSIQNRYIYTFTEKKASFPGGEQELFNFIQKNLIYPDIKEEVYGTIYVSFIVEPDGKVTYKSIRRSLNPNLDKAAMNVVEKMPPWLPAMCEGVAVPVIVSIPVKIYLR